eukprot:3027861-Alexandrium_andersonii.AAC.1
MLVGAGGEASLEAPPHSAAELCGAPQGSGQLRRAPESGVLRRALDRAILKGQQLRDSTDPNA